MALELKYSASQEHQVGAVEAVCDLFRGQEFMDAQFTAEMAGGDNSLFSAEVLQVGHANGLRLSAGQLEKNLHAVQEDQSLPRTDVLTEGCLRDFSVEMETGTGKTYVYIRSIYELNRRYGLTKFIIVVPSVAIREGVRKSFESTRAHFGVLYDNTPLEYFVYDSKDMGPVGGFATSSSIQVMIINIGAFNKGFADDGSADEGNLFHRPSERLIGGQSPRELVSQCRPIVIIDEPQSVDNTPKAKAAIRSLKPLFVLRYSATHKEAYNKVYSLTPVDAFQKGLVKGICVDSVQAQDDLNGAYVRLESVKASPFSASLTIDVRQKDGSQKRKKVTVKPGDDLYQKSNENADYEAGWIVSNIDVRDGEECVEFQNGETLLLGQAVGDVAADAVKRAQIRRTIEDHLQRQLELWPRGIKVLSLFFIDKVEKYRLYEPDVHNGEYAQMFEEEYDAAVSSLKWKMRYEQAGVPLDTNPVAVHSGYFARDGKDNKGKFKNTSASASTEADISAFELIMREKETLLSFPGDADSDKERAKKRVQFIFSHSALKEGWDNPNVFQICTLVETKDTMTKRQKIGRGLRLCVDQNGERCYDRDVNVLTVIANESYDNFANGLQKEFEAEDFKFGIITPESFTKVVIQDANGNEQRLGYERSKQVYDHFVASGMVDSKGSVTPELKAAAQEGKVELPAELAPAKEAIEGIIIHKSQKVPIRNKRDEVTVELQKDVTLQPAFQELWNRIRQRTRFEVEVDSAKLIEQSIEAIDGMMAIKPPQITSERADLSVSDAGVTSEGTGNSVVKIASTVEYDLPDPIAELQDAVGLTRATLKAILEGCSRFDEFKVDPATFLAQVGEKINKVKTGLIAKGIKYVRLPEDEWYTMSDLELDDFTAYLDQNAWKPEVSNKSIYNYVVYDSAGVERSFAEALDKQDEVLVFAKLPSSFKIDTPLGSYNPDWAYVEESNGEHRVYFVTETKGGKNGEPNLRDAEKLKIACAEKHFEALALEDFEYKVRTSYEYGATSLS